MTLRSDYPHNSTKRRLNSTDVHRAPRFHDSAYQSAIASVSRRGRVKRQVRYALIATGRPLTTGELLPWAYPRLTKFKDWPYTTHYVCSSCTYFIDYFIFTPTHISFSIPAVGGRLEFFLSSGSLLSAAALIDVYVLEAHDNPIDGGSDLRDAHGTISAPVPQVPLPGTFPLFATGLGVLGLLGWRRKRKASHLNQVVDRH
jgi:hypothetical protein